MSASAVLQKPLSVSKGSLGLLSDLSLVCGPMFAGKTSQLINDHRVWDNLGVSPLVFAPVHDTRHKSGLHTHSGISLPEDVIHRISSIEQMHDILGEQPEEDPPRALLFDEAQFFDAPMFSGDLLKALAEYAFSQPHKISITFYGLDLDAEGGVFPIVQSILSMQQVSVKKLMAKCHVCGAEAPYTKRIAPISDGATPQYAVGGSESYQPACRDHW